MGAVVSVEAGDAFEPTTRLIRKNPEGASTKSVFVYMVVELSRQTQQWYLLLVSERATC